MNPSQEDAPVGNGSLAGSQTRLIDSQASRGGSNSRALKIAGLTTLACALLASQIFTALMVFDQNKQIEDLHRKSERLVKEFTRTSKAVAPSKMQMPLRSLPMITDFAFDGETKKAETTPPKPAPSAESSASPSPMTKCQQEAAPGQGRIGSYKPQCDKHGAYYPRQCWHATGYCWCVDKTGKRIEGTAVRGLPKCDGEN